jgi:hypothetical protein
MEKAMIKNSIISAGLRSLIPEVVEGVEESKGRLIAINHITNSDKQDAIMVKNLTPNVPEKRMLLKKVIRPTMGGWSK